MLTPSLVRSFLSEVRGQPLREGTRYARQARVGTFAGSDETVSTVVRGQGGDYGVVLWSENGRIAHRCECPSWRDPCKHEVAAALVLQQWLGQEPAPEVATAPPRGRGGRARKPAVVVEAAERDPDEARRLALEERRTAARRESLRVRADAEPPYLLVTSPSGFAYRVQVRGAVGGPHSCDCPDFEANRLHTCKHVERVRRFLSSGAGRLLPAHQRAARRARVYVHFGEVLEPRLFGRPSGDGAEEAAARFDTAGVPLDPLAHDEQALLAWLKSLGEWVERDALAYLRRRIAWRPELPPGDVMMLLPRLTLSPHPYQRDGIAFLARSGRALLADEMGLGKTAQAILAAAVLRHAREAARHVTVVCPASLRGGWQDEIRRWLGEEVVLLEGPAQERARTIAARPTWLVTHYEQVLRDRAHRDHPPDLLIVDEAQRAKGLSAQTARALKAIPSRYMFALTGTPLENRLEEAYAIAQLIDQRLLPPLWQLDRDCFVREKGGRRVVGYRGLGALRSRLSPVPGQYPDLPQRIDLPGLPQARSGMLTLVLAALRALLVTRAVLVAENLALRQELAVLARRSPRARLRPRDRAFWVLLRRLWSGWQDALILVQPKTVIRGHARASASIGAGRRGREGRADRAPKPSSGV